MQTVCEEYDVVEGARIMTLSRLLDGVTVTKLFQTMFGRMVVTHEVEVANVHYDSRRIGRGDMFVAIAGAEYDGHAFINNALDKGAKAVVMENDQAVPDSLFMHAGVVKIVVPNSRIALAQISANYFDHPSEKLTMIGVTGTNGKTTTTNLVHAILEAQGTTAGLIGTIEYNVGRKKIPATHTTPESLELNGVLCQMVNNGCTSVVMEVSSHALHQSRVHGLDFDVAIFTNLTQDHLDYHGSMEEYYAAKKILFERLKQNAFAVINRDDEWGPRMITSTGANVLTYGMHPSAEVQATDVSLSMTGTRFAVRYKKEQTVIQSPLVGRFNVYNILAAFAAGIALGASPTVIQQGIQNTTVVPGRFQQVASPDGWTAIIDYAHTPDALEKALMAIHDVFESSVRGRIVTVFGCGGNRDRTKRPRMAKIATELSDITIVTSDNPRHEHPDDIIDEIMTGVKQGATVFREVDRSKAIVKALGIAGKNDVVLIAGKGHEEYQIFGNEKIHFSDREIVEHFLRPGT